MLAFSETAFSSAAKRVVFDTNVLVSLYVFADSRFAPLRERIENGEWLALAAYAAKAAHHTGPVQPEPAALPRCKDRDDQKFLELARDAGADWLVTADKALLRLARGGRLRGLFRILTPEAALAET